MQTRYGAICEAFPIKSPFYDEAYREVAISQNSERMRQLIGLGRKNSIFEAYYNVCGLLPEVNNVGHHEKSTPFKDEWGGIRRAHAIYKGIKRPCNRPKEDEDVYIYVTKPRFRYKYEPDMVCVAKRVEAPKGYLFVAFVRFENKLQVGEVLNWEWVEADQQYPLKPIGYQERYQEEVWNNE